MSRLPANLDRTRYLVDFGKGSLVVSIPVTHNKFAKPIHVLAVVMGLALKENEKGSFTKDKKPLHLATEIRIRIDLTTEEPNEHASTP